MGRAVATRLSADARASHRPSCRRAARSRPCASGRRRDPRASRGTSGAPPSPGRTRPCGASQRPPDATALAGSGPRTAASSAPCLPAPGAPGRPSGRRCRLRPQHRPAPGNRPGRDRPSGPSRRRLLRRGRRLEAVVDGAARIPAPGPSMLPPSTVSIPAPRRRTPPWASLSHVDGASDVMSTLRSVTTSFGPALTTTPATPLTTMPPPALPSIVIDFVTVTGP